MLQLKGVSKQLGSFQLQDINLVIEESEYFIVLGPTGTGKTVMLELIAGMYRPDQGEIYYKHKRIDSLSPEQRDIAFVYQDYALFPHMNVQENITYGLRFRKLGKSQARQHLDEIAHNLNIDHLLAAYPGTLSGGEKQRTAIARALITCPRILLLDEPLSALDPSTKQLFLGELRRLHDLIGMTTIHVTHDFTEALALGDRIAVMQAGQMVQIGPALEVFRKPSSVYVARFLGAANVLAGRADHGKITLAEGISIVSLSQKQGNVNISIRPEDIMISKTPLISSARNSLEGKITALCCQGPLFKINLDCGIELESLVTFQAAMELDLKVGDTVWATFKSTAVNVF